MMNLAQLALSAFMMVILAGCGSSDGPGQGSATGESSSDSIAHDLTTPEGAILSLEDAYRAKDVEAAVRCKDFNAEAKLMLQSVNPEFSEDSDMVAQTAEVLELGFRSEVKEKGFPDFRDVVCTFSDRKPVDGRDDMVEITEQCTHSDGSTSTNKLGAVKSNGEWRVVVMVE